MRTVARSVCKQDDNFTSTNYLCSSFCDWLSFSAVIIYRPTCSSMTLCTVHGSTMRSRWRTLRPFFLVRKRLLSLAAGKMMVPSACGFNFPIWIEFIDWFCFFVYEGTLMRFRGVRLVPSTLLSLLVSSLTRTRLLLTSRYNFNF